MVFDLGCVATAQSSRAPDWLTALAHWGSSAASYLGRVCVSPPCRCDCRALRARTGSYWLAMTKRDGCRPSLRTAQSSIWDKSATLPPAAVVLVLMVCSEQKRGR